MITTLTDGMAILAVRYRFFDLLWAVGNLAGLVLGFVVIPLALLIWAVWAIFFNDNSDAVQREAARPVAVQAPVATDNAIAQTPATVAATRPTPPARVSEYAAANAVLLESAPPQSKEEHLSAARTAISNQQPTAAAYHIKMVMHHELQHGMQLSDEAKDLMQDATMLRMNSSDIGNFLSSASEKYKHQWSKTDQRMYDIMRSVVERQ